jgi:hypothetical protein
MPRLNCSIAIIFQSRHIVKMAFILLNRFSLPLRLEIPSGQKCCQLDMLGQVCRIASRRLSIFCSYSAYSAHILLRAHNHLLYFGMKWMDINEHDCILEFCVWHKMYLNMLSKEGSIDWLVWSLISFRTQYTPVRNLSSQCVSLSRMRTVSSGVTATRFYVCSFHFLILMSMKWKTRQKCSGLQHWFSCPLQTYTPLAVVSHARKTPHVSTTATDSANSDVSSKEGAVLHSIGGVTDIRHE